MVRPSPVPPYVRVIEPSACVKASKTLCLTVQRDADAGVPDGEVQHDVRRVSPPRCVTRSTTSPWGVNLMAFPSRLTRIWRRRPGSPLSVVRHGRIDIDDQFEALLVRPQRHRVRRVADGIAGVEVDRVELELARLHPGEVQDVVDDGQQRIGGRLDDPQILALFGRELGVQHEIGHPDDAVHRRPNLVTHVRQELALGPVGGLGGVFGRSQLGLRRVALGDVCHDADDPDRIAARRRGRPGPAR